MMKQSQRLFLILPLLLALVSGCGKYSKNADSGMPMPTSSPTPYPTGTPPPTPGHTDPVDPATVWTTGGSAAFVPVNNEVFNKWVSGHPVEPKNVMINVKLTKASGKSTYYGTVKIRYQSNGQTFEATLKADNTTYDNKDFYMYNYWFNFSGKKVFSGFFDDTIGGIVLVVDQNVDLGDGGGSTEIGGEVWFRNYQASWAGYAEGGAWSVVLPCWFRTIGPYNCQSNIVMTKTSLYPTDTYQKLGDFTNMNKQKAFGN
jgi:hypothetical protein